MSRLHVSSHAFGGPTKTHFRTSRFECVSTMKNKSLHKSFQAPKMFPALTWVALHSAEDGAYLVLTLWKMIVRMWRSAPHLRIRESHLNSLIIPRGLGCSCHGNNVSDTITSQSTNTFTMVGGWVKGSKVVRGIRPEASSGNSASSTLCRR